MTSTKVKQDTNLTEKPQPIQKKSWSLRDLWISTSREELLKSENTFLNLFLKKHKNLFKTKTEDVSFYYDCTPLNLRNKKKRSSSLYNLFSFSSSKNKKCNNTKNDTLTKNDHLKQEEKTNHFIHMTTFDNIPDNNNSNEKDNHNLTPIVLMHGYGCAGGVFFPSMNSIFTTINSRLSSINTQIKNDILNNINDKDDKDDKDNKDNKISNNKNINMPNLNYKIHVLDWLGNGASSRPKFDYNNFTLEDTENWFVESLELWRKAMNYSKIILIGHSLGGYMSAVYALKYPQHIARLILLSPVGVPEPPPNSGDLSQLNWKSRLLFKTFRSFWNQGITPHDIVRYSGPKGKDWVTKLVKKRLERNKHGNHLDDNSKVLLAQYLYHVYAGVGSAEYALGKVLLPGAWAVRPLVKRVVDLKQYQYNPEKNIKSNNNKKYDNNNTTTNNNNNNNNNENELEQKNDEINSNNNDEIKSYLEIDCVYGEVDWMKPDAFIKLNKENKLKSNVYFVKDCGHQMLLENTSGFGTLLGKLISKHFKTELVNKYKNNNNNINHETIELSNTISENDRIDYIGFDLTLNKSFKERIKETEKKIEERKKRDSVKKNNNQTKIQASDSSSQSINENDINEIIDFNDNQINMKEN